jgi:guanylate kinase
MRGNGALLESAEVHGNFYGTPRAEVEDRIAAGHDVVFDIDWQGTRQLTKTCRQDMVTVFVLPPSIDELKSRLETRAQNSPEEIARRLANARKELEHWHEYDYVIVNRDLNEAVERVEAFLKAGRNARERQIDLESFVKDLQAQIDSVQ